MGTLPADHPENTRRISEAKRSGLGCARCTTRIEFQSCLLDKIVLGKSTKRASGLSPVVFALLFFPFLVGGGWTLFGVHQGNQPLKVKNIRGFRPPQKHR